MKRGRKEGKSRSNRYIIRNRWYRKGGAKWFKSVYITKVEDHKGGLVGKVL